MSDAQRIYSDPHEVEDQLAKLLLTREAIEESVKRGLLAKLETTPFHPVTSGGFNFWSETVRALREKLVPRGVGWALNNDANQGLIENKQTGVSVAVAGGDRNVGIRTSTPSTRSNKGPRMVDAVRNNSGWLFADMDPVRLMAAHSQGLRSLWLLLVHLSSFNKAVQLELSRPIKMGEGTQRRPIGWSERILFPPIPYGEGMVVVPPAESGPKTPEVRIEIKRRA